MVSSLYAETLHGRSLYGELKYPANFTHFDYVNPGAPKGGDMTMGAQGTFDSLNPFVIKGNPAAGLQGIHPSYLHATLLKMSRDEPCSKYGYVAESFEVASDNSSVTFNLRPTATFHDGTPITVDDVIYSFNTLTTKGLPFYKAYYSDVQKVEKISERCIKFIFKNNDNKELALILGEFPILSKRYYEQAGFEKSNLTIPLGSGPYRISRVDAGHSIVYERIQNWWGENIPVNKGTYNVNTIRYDYYRDPVTAFEAFKKGATDVYLNPTAKDWATGFDFDLYKQGKIVKAELTFDVPKPTQGFMFNTRREHFKNPKVRQAMSLLYDFEWANKNLFYDSYKRATSYLNGSELAARGDITDDEYQFITSFISASSSIPTLNQVNKTYTLQPTGDNADIRSRFKTALQLITNAGYEVVDGKLINKQTQQSLNFTILMTSNKNTERVVQSYVNTLNKFGANVDIRIVDDAQFIARIQDFDFDMIFANVPMSVSPGNELQEYWGYDRADIKGSQNLSGVRDPMIDASIEKIVKASSREELIKATRLFDRLAIAGHYMVLGYYSAVTRFAHNAKIKHPEITPKYYLDFDTYWIDQSSSKSQSQTR